MKRFTVILVRYKIIDNETSQGVRHHLYYQVADRKEALDQAFAKVCQEDGTERMDYQTVIVLGGWCEEVLETVDGDETRGESVEQTTETTSE